MAAFFFLLSSFFSMTLVGAGILFYLNRSHLQMERRVSLFITDSQDKKNAAHHDRAEQKKNVNKVYQRVVRPSLKKARTVTDQKMAGYTRRELAKKLEAAGYPFNWNPVDFRLTQIFLGLTFFLVIFLLFVPVSDDARAGRVVLLSVVAGLFGFLYPKYYLEAKKKQRVKAIERGMPDFFDMLNLSIEAGMGLDGAIARVCRQLQGPLSEEFLRTLEDMKLGKSRRQAFSELRDRVPSDPFQSIINALIQADHLGIGMSKVLRSLTQRIREQRREQAREQAMKAPVKMLFPMVFFIFPSLFIVLLGPLVIFLITDGLGF
ncbi:MAG: type II secretion system F family protein [Bacillaceae bacterium]|nr:type II secretion system F family protein [Bacillaceae bacterium]